MIVICYLPLYCRNGGSTRVKRSVLHAARMKGKKVHYISTCAVLVEKPE
jgi:hypothetical protein